MSRGADGRRWRAALAAPHRHPPTFSRSLPETVRELEALEHLMHPIEGIYAFDRDFEVACCDRLDDLARALLPGRRARTDMADMEAREGERAAHEPLPQIGKGLRLCFSVAHDMTEIANTIEAAIEDAAAGRIDDLVNAFATRKLQHDRAEILLVPVDDATGAELERSLLLAGRANRADDGRTGGNAELCQIEADAAADGVHKQDVTCVGAADRVEQVPGRQRLNEKGSGLVEADRLGDAKKRLCRHSTKLGERTGILREAGNPIADRNRRDARADRRDLSREFYPRHQRITLGVRIDAPPHHRIGEVEATIGHAHLRLTWTGDRLERIADDHGLAGASRLVENDSTHSQGSPPLSRGAHLCPQPPGRIHVGGYRKRKL